MRIENLYPELSLGNKQIKFVKSLPFSKDETKQIKWLKTIAAFYNSEGARFTLV